ncbi:MAG: bifunctional metallophosphatase/5'-nucleotidase [Solobacterium sp.]|nr:bifunctional metallophosphatase/5'-nucleotidase [Solobacterium sp.]
MNLRTIHSRFWLSLAVLTILSGCTAPGTAAAPEPSAEAIQETAVTEPAPSASTEPAASSGDIVILYTSDMHCGVTEGFGVVGLQQVCDALEAKGAETILVDDGDAIQGELLGTMTRGEAITDLMNALQYDVAIPGNHEFDFGMEQFLSITQKAEVPYISCNFVKDGKLVFDPYIIKEVNGKKIAFIGVTTPQTLRSTAPSSFMDENGNVIYGFLQDEDGSQLFEAVQNNIDEVRAKGADFVILMCHLGNEEANAPYNFQTLIEHISGVDALLDGHSHDTDQVVMNDREGKSVIRSACGTKLQGIGYLMISGKDNKLTSGLYSWNNEVSVPELFAMGNEMSDPLSRELSKMEATLARKVGSSEFSLVIYDPNVRNPDGGRKRIARLRETNLGDFAADAFRIRTGADIAFINGSGLRDDIKEGEISYKDIFSVCPFSNQLCVSELTGQQIMDMLEWSSSRLPEESTLMQVSGMSYEIDVTVPSPCSVDSNGWFASVDGKRRVSNIMIGDEPLDVNKTYQAASVDYYLKKNGGGFMMFDPSNVVIDEIMTDSQALINYIEKDLGGVISEAYSDPYGQGRIRISGMPE